MSEQTTSRTVGNSGNSKPYDNKNIGTFIIMFSILKNRSFMSKSEAGKDVEDNSFYFLSQEFDSAFDGNLVGDVGFEEMFEYLYDQIKTLWFDALIIGALTAYVKWLKDLQAQYADRMMVATINIALDDKKSLAMLKEMADKNELWLLSANAGFESYTHPIRLPVRSI